MTARWTFGFRRRALLSLLPATIAVSVAGRFALATGPEPSALGSLYPELMAEPGRRALGVRYAASFPDMNRRGFEHMALEAIGPDADRLTAGTLRERIRERSAQDFRDGRIERVDGWRLSRLEAVLLAAAAR